MAIDRDTLRGIYNKLLPEERSAFGSFARFAEAHGLPDIYLAAVSVAVVAGSGFVELIIEKGNVTILSEKLPPYVVKSFANDLEKAVIESEQLKEATRAEKMAKISE